MQVQGEEDLCRPSLGGFIKDQCVPMKVVHAQISSSICVSVLLQIIWFSFLFLLIQSKPPHRPQGAGGFYILAGFLQYRHLLTDVSSQRIKKD